uniref:Uncharacterized protein n=1 Tax=Euplotes harpa TaxID=151035 RepID=A0A7S3JMN1_9SPIT
MSQSHEDANEQNEEGDNTALRRSKRISSRRTMRKDSDLSPFIYEPYQLKAPIFTRFKKKVAYSPIPNDLASKKPKEHAVLNVNTLMDIKEEKKEVAQDNDKVSSEINLKHSSPAQQEALANTAEQAREESQ